MARVAFEALNEAIHKFGPPEIMDTEHGRVIDSSCHAGQGSRFPAFAWTDRLKTVGTRTSKDGKGRCLDNPRAFLRTDGRFALDMSRLWRSLTYECVHLHAWEAGSQDRAGVGCWITFYNHLRPHAAHGGQLPAVICFNVT